MKNLKTIFTNAATIPIFIALLALNGCKSDDTTKKVDEQELLTTVRLTYTNQANITDIVKVTWKDIDGAGGAAPIIDNLNLKANTTYTVAVEVLDESKTPAENKTPEILSEGAEHQFFYAVNPSALLSVSYADKDTKNLPIGLTTSQKTSAVGDGKLKITLKHQPNLKSATSTITTGETDIEVEFNVSVK
jgi:hypothetical protein